MADQKKTDAPKATESVTFIRAWRHGGKDYKVDGKATVTPAAKTKLLKRQAVQK